MNTVIASSWVSSCPTLSSPSDIPSVTYPSIFDPLMFSNPFFYSLCLHRLDYSLVLFRLRTICRMSFRYLFFTGTPHLQGYCEYKSTTWNNIRAFLGPRCVFKKCNACLIPSLQFEALLIQVLRAPIQQPSFSRIACMTDDKVMWSELKLFCCKSVHDIVKIWHHRSFRKKKK